MIVTQTDKTNEHLFDKKILGLSSAEWIVLRVGDLFKRVVFQKESDCPKGCVCIDWDQTLVDKTTLGQDCGVRLNNQTFAYIQKTLQSYVIDNLVAKGVVVHDRQGLHIDQTADIQSGAEIFAPNVICGNSQIDSGTVVYPYCFLQQSSILCDKTESSRNSSLSQVGFPQATNLRCALTLPCTALLRLLSKM